MTDAADLAPIREAVRALCADFPGEYWRRLDRERAYPTEFVAALTKAGFLAALIPEQYGGSGLTMTAAREWGKFNVRANSICFGVVETPMTEVIRGDKFRDGIMAQIPMVRWAQPEEVVKTVCFLLSDASSYITGQHLGVNGGFHISV